MKRLFAASLAGLALLSGSARAADLPPAAPPTYKAPAMVTPAYNWSGFYLNAGGGYGMWNADTQFFTPAGACAACLVQTFGGRGYLGTAGGGFDYQIGGLGMGAWNPMIVVGLMADYDFESLKGTMTDGGLSAQIKETASWAGGARIGLAFGPTLFTYMNGGATGTRFGGGNFNNIVTGAPSGATSAAFWKTGWFLGGGTETSLAPILPVGWFWRSEYRYSYFSTTNVPLNVGGAPVLVAGWHPTVQTLSTSIVYKFNWQ
jgi:outer membrane immunogenic protein